MRYVGYILSSVREGDEGGDVGHVTELPSGPRPGCPHWRSFVRYVSDILRDVGHVTELPSGPRPGCPHWRSFVRNVSYMYIWRDVGHVTELPSGPVLDAHTGEAL